MRNNNNNKRMIQNPGRWETQQTLTLTRYAVLPVGRLLFQVLLFKYVFSCLLKVLNIG